MKRETGIEKYIEKRWLKNLVWTKIWGHCEDKDETTKGNKDTEEYEIESTIGDEIVESNEFKDDEYISR